MLIYPRGHPSEIPAAASGRAHSDFPELRFQLTEEGTNRKLSGARVVFEVTDNGTGTRFSPSSTQYVVRCDPNGAVTIPAGVLPAGVQQGTEQLTIKVADEVALTLNLRVGEEMLADGEAYHLAIEPRGDHQDCVTQTVFEERLQVRVLDSKGHRATRGRVVFTASGGLVSVEPYHDQQAQPSESSDADSQGAGASTASDMKLGTDALI